MSENNTSGKEPANNNIADNSLSGAAPHMPLTDDQANQAVSGKLFTSPPDIHTQFKALAKDIKENLQKQEDSIFEKLQLQIVKLEKRIEENDQQKKQLEQQIQQTDERTNQLLQTSNNAKKDIKRMSREVKITERKSLEFLGIFVTLFTFISVSASALLQFKTVYHSIFFLLSFCFCLLLFLHLFHLILRNEKIGKKSWTVFYFIVLASCVCGAILCHKYGNQTPRIREDEKHSLQINYTQTNGYGQTITSVAPKPLPSPVLK